MAPEMSTSNGTASTPPSVSRAADVLPLSSRVTSAATFTIAKSPCRRLTSINALPIRAGTAGIVMSTSSSSGSMGLER